MIDGFLLNRFKDSGMHGLTDSDFLYRLLFC